METMTRIKKIPNVEELETITRGQKAIISNEGVMKFTGSTLKTDPSTNKLEEFAIFLSEINLDNGEIGYKKIYLKPVAIPLEYSKEIIEKDNEKEYLFCQRKWRSLN
jgi:hypothetical protein